ncbi:hypothetical protein JXM67_15190 [candidate division WOR-3 bacterium]|nr:hypothetical protein [candidate division WOR-3 bacterium]
MRSKDKKTSHLKRPERTQDVLIARMLASFEERFGIDSKHFHAYRLFTRSNDVWCSSLDAGKAEFPHVVRRGLRLARVFDFSVKPTTNAVQLFGHLVKRNRIDLDPDETRLFLKGETQKIEAPRDATDGFVAAFYKGFALGIGLLKGENLKSQVPRSRRVIG